MKKMRSVLLVVMSVVVLMGLTGCTNTLTQDQADEIKKVGDECKASFDELKTGIEDISVYYQQEVENFDAKFDVVKKGYEDALTPYSTRTKEYNEKGSDTTEEEAKSFLELLKSTKTALETQKKNLEELKTIVADAIAAEGAEQ